MGCVQSLWVIPELCEESIARMNRHLGPVRRGRVLVINGNGLHHVAIITRECTPIADSTPHAHVKCVVGGRFLGVVQPEHKIVLSHILPEHEVLFITQLSMYSSMCLRNVRVELSWCYRRTSRRRIWWRKRRFRKRSFLLSRLTWRIRSWVRILNCRCFGHFTVCPAS